MNYFILFLQNTHKYNYRKDISFCKRFPLILFQFLHDQYKYAIKRISIIIKYSTPNSYDLNAADISAFKFVFFFNIFFQIKKEILIRRYW